MKAIKQLIDECEKHNIMKAHATLMMDCTLEILDIYRILGMSKDMLLEYHDALNEANGVVCGEGCDALKLVKEIEVILE